MRCQKGSGVPVQKNELPIIYHLSSNYMARVYLIYLDLNTGYFPGLHYGLASLSAVIRQKGHVLEFYHLFNEEPPEAIAEKVLKFNPDIVGFSLTTNQRKYLEKYSKAIYSQSKVLQVAGGTHPTLDAMDVLKVDSIQGVCIGEAEQTFPNLLNKLDRGESVLDVAGFWWQTPKGAIKQNPVPPLEPDLSKLPYPDYSIFKVKEINEANSGWMSMMVTRGCPYNCHYCCNHALRSIYPNKKDYVRLPPVEYAIRIIKNDLSRYPGVKGVNFADDLFIFYKEWFKEFAERYGREVGLPFICNVRVEDLTEDICSALKKAGCTLVQIGLESGNEWFRKYFLNRRMSNDQIVKAFQLLKDFDIQKSAYNILGFPFETKQFMEDTLSLNKRVRPEMGGVFYFFPYPGTRLYSICEEFGLLSKKSQELSGYLERPAIHLTHCNISDCKKIYNKLRLYLWSRRAVKDLRFGSSFISTLIYFLFSICPWFFIGLFTKRSRLKHIVRKIAYKKLFRQGV